MMKARLLLMQTWICLLVVFTFFSRPFVGLRQRKTSGGSLNNSKQSDSDFAMGYSDGKWAFVLYSPVHGSFTENGRLTIEK